MVEDVMGLVGKLKKAEKMRSSLSFFCINVAIGCKCGIMKEKCFTRTQKDPIETYFHKWRGMSMVYAHSGYM